MAKYIAFALFILNVVFTAAQPKFSEPSNAFKVGEELVYAAQFGIIKGGEATIKLGMVENGPDFLYHAKATAETTGGADFFFTVRDIYESKQIRMVIETLEGNLICLPVCRSCR